MLDEDEKRKLQSLYFIFVSSVDGYREAQLNGRGWRGEND